MGISVETLAAAKKYTNDSIEGITGSLAGKNATIESITDITGGHRVTFKWTADNGDVRTQTMDVMDGSKGDKGETGDTGLGIKAVNINAQDHLIITFDDDTTYDAGELPGGSGEVISVNGKKGVVTLDANDVGALPDDTELFSGDYNDLDNLPDLTNFITNTVDNLVNYYKKTETYTKAEVDNIANTIKNGRFEVVATLPTTDIKTNVIYLVPKSTTQTSNVKDEYINLDGTSAGWEKIGDTEIDLSGYVTTTALNTALAAYTTTTNLTALLAGKVDKVTGKGLSTNDYADTDKELVDTIPTLAPISLVKDTVGWIGKNKYNGDNPVVLIKSTKRTYESNKFEAQQGDEFTLSFDISAVANFDLSNGINAKIIDDTNTDVCASFDFGYEEGHVKHTFKITGTPNGLVRIYFFLWSAETSDTATATLSNIMVYDASITDDTYEPYHESVETMYEEEIYGVNLLDLKSVNAQEGITYVIGDNNRVSLSGTLSQGNWLFQYSARASSNAVKLKQGEYIFSIGVSIPKVSLQVGYTHPTTREFIQVAQSESGASKLKFTSPVSDRPWTIQLVSTAVTLSSVVTYPMLRKADIEDNTYRSYNEQAIQNQLDDKGVLGAKNLLPNTATSQTINGVTFTVNTDGSVTVSGTATANTSYVIKTKIPLTADKTYICSRGGIGDNDFQLVVTAWNSGSYVKNIIEVGAGDYTEKSFTPDYNGYDDIQISIFVRSGKTLSNAVVYPMLRLASDPDDTYQPYAMTNRELMKKVNALPREVFATTDTRTTTTNDANTLPCGFTRMNDENSNLPTDGTGGAVWYDILTVRQSNDPSTATWGYGFQLAVQTTTDANMGDTYIRAVNGGATPAWSAWKKLN